ncbi:MAG: hypothetical protein LQ338_003783 [Usnochroma carphineum]|nr:MAG: hypothetical protein LQ338_003783 [Usnochroma carphineum]
MAADYSKKKNAELEEMLKGRSLPHTGKKAELIARLQQADKDAAATANPTASDVQAEDEIDWDDDAVVPEIATTNASTSDVPAKSATTAAAATAIAAGGQGQALNPAAVPNQIPTTEPFKSDDIIVRAPGEAAEEASTSAENKETDEPAKTTEQPTKPPTDYTANIPATTVDDEIEKRKKRAARFGIVTDGAEKDSAKAASEDAIKALQRAKKFGTADASKPTVRGLDEALPERKKRGRGAEDDSGRGNKRSRGARRNGAADRRSRSKSKPTETKAAVANGDAKSADAKAAQREKDRLAAEARKKRFGTST